MQFLIKWWPTLYPWMLTAAVPYILWKTLQFIGRNYVALSGMAVPMLASEKGQTPSSGVAFVCRLQNLESVPFENRIVIRISALLTAPLSGAALDCVHVYAGWRAFDVSAESGPSRFCWSATAVALPGFDTWTFEFRLPANEVVFEVFAEGQEARKFLTPQFGKEIWPNTLTVYQVDTLRSRFEGPSMVPALPLPFLTAAFAIATHLLTVRLLHSLAGSDAPNAVFSSADFKIIGWEVVAIFFAYFLIRRRVQPVVPGYRESTPLPARDVSRSKK